MFVGISPFMSGAVSLPETRLEPRQRAEHLLNRAAFGPRPGEAEGLLNKADLERWLESQLHPESINDAVLEKKLNQLFVHRESYQKLLNEYLPMADSPKSADRIESVARTLIYQKFISAVESRRELEQVMVDFWFNHFDVDDMYPVFLVQYERDVIKAGIFGKFKDLLRAVAQSPAMLRYLNNAMNSKQGANTLGLDPSNRISYASPDGINENYARELLELHTLGVNNGYSQSDIINVAKALTGWTLPYLDNPYFAYFPAWHDESDHLILGTVFHGKEGMQEGEKVLNFLATLPETARYLSKKLCSHFVSDPASLSCIKLLSQTFQETDGDLRKIYETMFQSPDFWSPQSYRQRIKKPFEFSTSAARAVGSDIIVSDRHIRSFFETMIKLGEPIYACPTPTGYDDSNLAWSNSGTVLRRSIEAPNIIELSRPTIGVDRDRLSVVFREITGVDPSPTEKAELQKYYEKGENQKNARLLSLIISLPEFQRH